MQTFFELPLGKIFGGETTCGFGDIQKLLGFWEGRAFKRCVRMLTKLSSRHKWVDYLGISASGYGISSVDQVPGCLPTETVIVVSYANGRVDRFEVIGDKLRHYDRIDDWPEYSLPNSESGDFFQKEKSLRLTPLNEGRRLLCGGSAILQIKIFTRLGSLQTK